jgi:hypothetical protein
MEDMLHVLVPPDDVAGMIGVTDPDLPKLIRDSLAPITGQRETREKLSLGITTVEACDSRIPCQENDLRMVLLQDLSLAMPTAQDLFVGRLSIARWSTVYRIDCDEISIQTQIEFIKVWSKEFPHLSNKGATLSVFLRPWCFPPHYGLLTEPSIGFYLGVLKLRLFIQTADLTRVLNLPAGCPGFADSS